MGTITEDTVYQRKSWEREANPLAVHYCCSGVPRKPNLVRNVCPFAAHAVCMRSGGHSTPDTRNLYDHETMGCGSNLILIQWVNGEESSFYHKCLRGKETIFCTCVKQRVVSHVCKPHSQKTESRGLWIWLQSKFQTNQIYNNLLSQK